MNRPATNLKKKTLAVMKFGGTSVGNSAAIRDVMEIVRSAVCASEVVVVVSAMSGVTNQLLEAAMQAEAGKRDRVKTVFSDLRARHRSVIAELIRSAPLRGRVNLSVEQVLEEGERLCEGAALLRELTARTRDAISGLGERMTAPIMAAALVEHGLKSQSIEATELIRTDSTHGSAEPDMAATRELCEPLLRPLLRAGIVPIITGFIGATGDGVSTTLGRGGSDYSATILGAALQADGVTIWTDVDGLMTADPRLVPNAAIIREISYREAAELAQYGAKVLHPKTLAPVAECEIPVWIRNTFAPEQMGTRISSCSPGSDIKLRGLAAMSDPSDESLALVTAVGTDVRDPKTVAAILAGLGRENLKPVSISPATSEHSLSFAVAQRDLKRALEAVHGEFGLDTADVDVSGEGIPPGSDTWVYAPALGTASAD
jgi:bifunctional aspartokinase / homoserine dehydrogenase 1